MQFQEFGICPVAEDIGPSHNWPNYLRVTRILESVGTLALESGLAGQWNSSDFPRKMMLTLLAFAYADGLLRSDEIEERAASDPTLRYIASGRIPSASLIRSFRRGHRAQLETVLGEIFGLDRAKAILSGAILMDSVTSEV